MVTSSTHASNEPDPTTPHNTSRAGAAAMTSLAVAYPIVTAWYFWQDWFRYVSRDSPLLLGPWGLATPVSDMTWTLLSPWRVVAAMLTATALAVSARKLRKGAANAKALSLLVLGGAVLPQVFWYTEFANDWHQGRGVGAIVAGMLALIGGTAALVARRGGDALAGWASSMRGLRGRVLAAAAGMGWVGLAAMSVLDHIYQVPNAALSFFAAGATLPLTLLAMVGLFRQRTWGLLAAGGAAGALGATVAGLRGAEFVATGRAMDDVFNAVSATPVHTAAAAALPALVLTVLMAPFVRGLARRAAGGDAERAPASTGVRVAAGVDEAPRTPDEAVDALDEGAEPHGVRAARAGAGE